MEDRLGKLHKLEGNLKRVAVYGLVLAYSNLVILDGSN
jgi:hypothetical protein